MSEEEQAPSDLTFRSIVEGNQKVLLAQLESAALFDHPGAKGDVTEFDWCSVLRGWLPTRYQVSKAFVIDAHGGVSQQQDVVIHDRHFCPLFFEKDSYRFIPAEAVYAVFEVKQDLDRGNVLYAADKAASVRSLRRTSTILVDRGVEKPPRKEFRILSGILATRSDWNPAVGQPLVSALRDANPEGSLDLGCAVSGGAFAVSYEGGEPVLDGSPGDISLTFFIMKLFAALQRIGSVNALDMDAYARALSIYEGVES